MSIIQLFGDRLKTGALQAMFATASPLFLLLVFIPCHPVAAQELKIRLVNGQTGLPMSHSCVDLGMGHMGHMLAIPTDESGDAHFYITSNDAKIDTKVHSKECGTWGVIAPTVEWANTIGIHVGYVLCQSHKSDYSWLARMTFETMDVIRKGIVTENTCGRATAPLTPGMIVIFVRPPNWWEKLKQ